MPNPNETNPYINGQEDWITAVDTLIAQMPLFQSVDLIVEGCIGGNEWCAYWLKKAYPNAVYVGVDMAENLNCLNNGRLDKGVSPEIFERILSNQAQLTTDEGLSSRVTVRANCLSPALIESLKSHTDAKTTLLVTFNGLMALMGQQYVPGETKKEEDLTPASSVVTSPLFDLQLHVSENKQSLLRVDWVSRANVVTKWFYMAESAANEAGKETVRIKDGLVVVK